MNVIGIGLDATDLPRIRETLERYGDRFLRRVYTEGEIASCRRHRDPVPSLAGRFSVKEAAMKALGTGQSQGVIWRDIEVVRVGGPPQLKLHGAAARRAESMGVKRTLVTITHAQTIAIAQVLLIAD